METETERIAAAIKSSGCQTGWGFDSPSEAARKVFPGDSWRSKMTVMRSVALDLAKSELVEITQRGRVVSDNDFKGPVRIRYRRR